MLDRSMALAHDVRIALRQLRRAPGFTAAAAATLALAIGAATVMFSAVQAVLLRPIPIAAPSSLVVAWGSNPTITAGIIELSYLDVADLGRESRSLARAAAVGASPWPTVLDGAGEPLKLAATGVSGSFFDTLGAAAHLGRTIGPDDDQPGSPSVVVLGHDLWTGRFGGDPAIVGRSITLDGEPSRVIGVMPRGFDFPRGTDLWTPAVPVMASPDEGWKTKALRSVGVFYLLGRTREGADEAALAGELSGIARRVQGEAGGPSFDIVSTPFADHYYGPARPALWTALAAVALLLLIACANVSGLMLTRAALRARDSAVRLALGATRGAIARQWAIEALLLALAGGAAGWLAAAWAMDGLVALAPEGVPGLSDATLNATVAVVSLLVVGAAALICSVGPMRQAGGTSPVETLADGGRTATAGRSLTTRATLQVAQTALAVVLLVSAGLVVRSFSMLSAVDLGFDPDSTLTLAVEPRMDQRPANEWMRDLVARASGLPGVEAAGAVYLRPLALGPIGQGTTVTLEGQPETDEAARANPILNYQVATPGYFEAMRIRLRRGRTFTAEDTATAPRVTIVSESTAARLWPGQDPIGRRLRTSTFEFGTGRKAWREVVGVVSDVRYRGLREVQLDMYDPAAQTPMPATDLVLRTSVAPLSVLAAIEREARAMDPRVIISRVATLDAIVTRARAPWRFSAWMFSLFAVLAVVLSTVGLAGLVALDVANRREEFAIRSALGAASRTIVHGVMRVALARVVAGVSLGLVLSLAATRALAALLVGVTSSDWPTYGAVVSAVLAVTFLASWVPARRAAASSPLALLRRE
ncbi:MAG: ADOP family duplicated permease [Vicinamibacterales bacterium]